MKRYKKGEGDFGNTIFGIITGIFVVIVILLSYFVLHFALYFVGVPQRQVNAKNEIESGKQNRPDNKFLAILRAQNSQVIIWALDPKYPDGDPIVVGLGIIRDEATVIAARHIFNDFYGKSLYYFATLSDFYNVENISVDMATLIERIEPRGAVSLLAISEKDRTFGETRGIIFLSKNRRLGDKIFVLGDHNNAEALEKIDGKIVEQDNENLIVELSTANSDLIDRQIALGATVWDAKGNFIGFLAERINATNRVRLIFLNEKSPRLFIKRRGDLPLHL